MHPEVLELGPSDVPSAAPILSFSPVEAAFLAPDHPFLRYSEWRAFAGFDRGRLAARFVAGIDRRQFSSGGTVGCIGFAKLGGQGTSTLSGASAGPVLAAAANWLRERRVGWILCPVQFSTWYGHRATTGSFPDSGGAPPFPPEPRDGRSLVDLMLANDFVPAHRAVSRAVDSEPVVAAARPALGWLRRAGLADRPLRSSRLDEELGLLHRLSTDIFRGSWSFSDTAPA